MSFRDEQEDVMNVAPIKISGEDNFWKDPGRGKGWADRGRFF